MYIRDFQNCQLHALYNNLYLYMGMILTKLESWNFTFSC